MREHPEKAGIYKLTHINTGKVYIGKSINLYKRLNRHKNSSVVRYNSYIQSAIAKHGWEAFTVEILEIFEPFDKMRDNQDLLLREAYYIELHDATNKNKGYNLCKFSNDNTGRFLTEEHKEKIRQSLLGKIRGARSEETKEKLRQANLGKRHSEESKEKMRNRPPISDETRAKLSESKMGRVVSKETREKISKAKMGKPQSEEMKNKLRGRKLSPEHIEKMRQARLGTTVSEETKEKHRMYRHSEESKRKISESQIGKRMSEEAKAKSSISAKKRGISPETRMKMLQTRKINRQKKLEELERSSLSH